MVGSEAGAESEVDAMTGIPFVEVDTQRDFETDITFMKSAQRWIKKGVPRTDPDSQTRIEMAIKIGETELIERATAHRYIVSYMSAVARRMIADGYIPYVTPSWSDNKILGFGGTPT